MARKSTRRKTKGRRVTKAKPKRTIRRKVAAKKRTTTRRKTAKRAGSRRKTTRRTTTAKRSGSRRRATTKRSSKSTSMKSSASTAIKTAYTKSKLLGELADQVGLKKKDVSEVLESLNNVIHRHLKKGGAGIFNLPGLLKCRVVYKPATKARKGINPFTGEETTFKAKPARYVVKVRPLKGLKEMVV